jgi:hypothetical protein
VFQEEGSYQWRLSGPPELLLSAVHESKAREKKEGADYGFSAGNGGSVVIISRDHMHLWLQPVNRFKLCEYAKGPFQHIKR